MNTTDLLPPMPTPDLWMPWRVVNAPDGSVHSAGYTADQMRAYAEAAAAEERKRCKNVLRYWLTWHAPATGTHEARCLDHVLDGRQAPTGWTDRA